MVGISIGRLAKPDLGPTSRKDTTGIMLEIKNVHKSFDAHTEILKGIDLKINKGDFVFLVGPSGAGKSTFVKLILKEIEAE